MSRGILLRLDPVTTSSFGELGHRQAPTPLQLRQEDDEQSGLGAGVARRPLGIESSLVLGRGGATCIFDPGLPESLVRLDLDNFARGRGWVKATLLFQGPGLSPVQINGRTWDTRSENRYNKRPRPSSSNAEHRYLNHGDVISLLNGHYTYRVSLFRGSDDRSTNRSSQPNAAVSGSVPRSAGTEENENFDPIVAQAVAEHLSRSNASSRSQNFARQPSVGIRSGRGNDQPTELLRSRHQESLEEQKREHDDKTSPKGSKDELPNETSDPVEAGPTKAAPEPAQDNDTTDTGVSVPSKTIEQLQDDVQCSVCLEILVNSHTLAPCGHTFCAPCIGIHNSGTCMRNCPNCRQPVRQKIPNRQIDSLVATLVQVPGLLNSDDVEHYFKRQKDYQKKVEAAKLKAATAKRPAKRSRTGRLSTAAAARMPWRDRRRSLESHSVRYGSDLGGPLHPSLSVAAASDNLDLFSSVAAPAQAAMAGPNSSSGNGSNNNSSGRGRSRGGSSAPVAAARTAQQQAQHDFDNLFRDADMDMGLFRQRAAWSAPVAAPPAPSAQASEASFASLNNSLAAAAQHQAQHQAAVAIASANRDYMLATAAAGPAGLYGGRTANAYLPAAAQAGAQSRFLDDLAALFPGASLTDTIFID